ncbi:tetratricopeptide repeat protein [Sphingomonas sp. MG17]|uniref:Tetratricopeptide repeat protein n=1 Tax=Sphingomonas tagetis TaxID=2949092 RepID=A0A9X2KJQ9_9SPHN|nr:tetratricopeptide repeat protein [Sphingomonas tagetis]MCP3728832.1 tetratricopeptide repeat protein [Sphingomonas tagetis]
MDMGAYPVTVAIAAAPVERADELEQAGRYRDAEPLRRAAFERARKGKAAALADIAEKLADNLAMQIRLADAEPFYRLALDARLKRHGEQHAATARSLRQLSALLLARGELGEAEQIARRSLTIQRAVSPAGDIEIAWSLNNLAQVRAARGQPFDADLLYRDAITIARATAPLAEDALAVLLNNRGLNFYRMAVSADIPLAFRRPAGTTRGVMLPVADDMPVADADRKRLLAQGRTLLNEALALAERRFGAEHPDTANLLNGLAANHLAAGERSRAEALYRRALTIKAKFLLPEDRDRIVGAWSLGAVLARLPGRGAEARTQLRAAAAGALGAQSRYREYDRAASAELRSYAPVFLGQVRVAWTLANAR